MALFRENVDFLVARSDATKQSVLMRLPQPYHADPGSDTLLKVEEGQVAYGWVVYESENGSRHLLEMGILWE